MTTSADLAYYTEPGPFTDPGRHRDALRVLPTELPALFEAVHGLLIHEHLTWAYGVDLRPDHNEASNLRHTEDMLSRLLADGRPLNEPREAAERIGGTCRDFTVLTVAALRAGGVPARARCGFGDYFPSSTKEDHWVVEYWNADEHRWILADSQIDERQRELFDTDLDFTDVPRDGFIVAGDAWRRCRKGEDDPNLYGLSSIEEFGDWWIAGNLIRDVAALSNTEMLPWDVWGAMPAPGEAIAPDLAEYFDELAALTGDPETAADTGRLYHDERLKVPEVVYNVNRKKEEPTLLRG